MTLEEAGQAYAFLVCVCCCEGGCAGKRKEAKESNGNNET